MELTNGGQRHPLRLLGRSPSRPDSMSKILSSSMAAHVVDVNVSGLLCAAAAVAVLATSLLYTHRGLIAMGPTW